MKYLKNLFDPEKTYKREVAVLILLFLFYVGYLSAQADPTETLRIMTIPMLGFILGAFGMDWYQKKIVDK